MDLIITTLLWWFVYIIIFGVAYNYLAKTPWRNLPPGPLALPLVGSLPFLGTDLRKPLMKMAAKYGDVFTIYLGMRRVVVLNGYDVIRDALVKKGRLFEDRASQITLDIFSKGYGFVMTNGAQWRDQRSQCIHAMKELGQNMFEDKILEEVSLCITELKKHSGTPFYPKPIIQISVSNVVTYILSGRHYVYDDPVFVRYLTFLRNAMHSFAASGLVNIFPYIRFLPGDLGGLKELETGMNELRATYQKWIDQSKADFKVGATPTNLIDAYLHKMSEKDCPSDIFNEKQLVGFIMDIFVAGNDSVATTITWATIFMTLNPIVQTRVQAEIDGVMDEHTAPTMYHRRKLPYTDACLHEIQRYADLAPLGGPRSTTEDVHFKGFIIPKGTMIIANLTSVLMDPELWPEPREFRPERFLDDQGKVKVRKEFIPFSAGKRQCAGEELARMELFLYFASIMKHFKFSPAPGYPLPETVGVLGVNHDPKPFHIVMEPRYKTCPY